MDGAAVALSVTSLHLEEAGSAGGDDLRDSGVQRGGQAMDGLRRNSAALETFPRQDTVAMPGHLRGCGSGERRGRVGRKAAECGSRGSGAEYASDQPSIPFVPTGRQGLLCTPRRERTMSGVSRLFGSGARRPLGDGSYGNAKTLDSLPAVRFGRLHMTRALYHTRFKPGIRPKS